ncbi:MAG: PAS domain-containing protein [Candidatus Heimdallarchaeota archaeon]|nr:MAG: PAS domain-containing protein [Candidatus Heimdallarchaeota archaeon]
MSSNSKPFDVNFTNLLDQIPSGIIILDKNNNNEPIFANRKVREDLHISNEQSIDKDIFLAFLDPSDHQKFIELSSSKILPGESEWKGLTFTGKQTWIQLRIAPLNEDYYIVVIRNIGKVKKIIDELSTTEAQYKAVMERDPNFLFILKNGVLEYYNQAFIEKLNYTEAEITRNKSMPTFFVAPEDREKVARFLIQSKRDLITGKVPKDMDNHNRYYHPDETTEFNLLRSDGSRIPVHAIVRRAYSTNDVFIQGVLIDLSSIKELQDMKLDFLTMTQHQLRTPLLNLKGYLDFYSKQLDKGVSTEEKQALESRFMEIFRRNIDQMVSLTKDLNDVALIQHGKLKCNLRGENINPILQKVIEDLEFLLRKYRIDLIVHYPTTPYIVNLDRDRISQALSNVLENAIRFTGHGIIEVYTSIINNGQHLKLTIEDNGVGIDATNLKGIGKPFVTFHPSVSRLGLGLYLTNEIISAHSGSLEITSSGFNKGTSVTITLPLLVSPDKEGVTFQSTKESSLNKLIRIATTSENMLQRMEAVHQLGNGDYKGAELERIISTLEKVILYDQDRTIRNLAGKFYSQKVELREKAVSDAS